MQCPFDITRTPKKVVNLTQIERTMNVIAPDIKLTAEDMGGRPKEDKS